MLRTHSQRRVPGVTLIEMMVVVLIIGVVLAAAIPSLTGFMERRRVVAVAAEIASFFAQAKAESTIVADKINLHMEEVPANVGDFSCLRLSTHSSADLCMCNRERRQVCSIGSSRLLREYLLERSTSVSFVAEADRWGEFGDHTITFLRGSFPTEVSNVRVTVTGARTNSHLRVEFNNAGRVRTCSPDGSFGGYPACA